MSLVESRATPSDRKKHLCHSCPAQGYCPGALLRNITQGYCPGMLLGDVVQEHYLGIFLSDIAQGHWH